MERTRQQWIRDTWLLVITTVVLLMYFVVNVPHDVNHVLNIPFDAQIPRVPIFSIPYLTYLPWLWGTLVYAWYKNMAFKQLAYSYILVDLVAFSVYMTFQTYIPHTPVMESDFFSNVLKFIYSHDLPYSAFPSLHTAMSAVIATYFVCRRSKWSWAAVSLATLIISSTLFTKQHFVVDIISGIILGVGVTWLVFRFIPSKGKVEPGKIITAES